MSNSPSINVKPQVERKSGRHPVRLAAVLVLGLIIGTVFGAVGSVHYVPIAESRVAAPFDEHLDDSRRAGQLQRAARITLPPTEAAGRRVADLGRGDLYAAAAHRRRNQPGRADWNRRLREVRLEDERDRKVR